MNVSDSKDIEHEKYKNNIIFFSSLYDTYVWYVIKYMSVIDIEWLILHKCDIGQLLLYFCVRMKMIKVFVDVS